MKIWIAEIRKLYALFLDLEKAYDCVDWKDVWEEILVLDMEGHSLTHKLLFASWAATGTMMLIAVVCLYH